MDVRLEHAIQNLTENLSERSTLAELARELRVSVRTLELLFKTHTGLPFVSFYRELRIAQAKYLLEETDEPVKVVAFDLGYRSVENFCRDFKRLTGYTAVEYRHQLRREQLRKQSIE